MDHIDKLQQFGFLRIGVFSGGEDLIALKQEGNLSSYINDKLKAMDETTKKKNVIYAYVVDGMVVYLGETERTFRERYNNHIRNLVDFAIENKPAYLHWVEFFKTTNRYEIWQMPAPQVEFRGLKVTIRQDFETVLIGEFDFPVMNTRTKGNRILQKQ
ncbi:MAG: hypothetical protein LLG15_04355 [Betaproteobacteria bacterium]|nr:hypothetical protein [Betaproteobacteria bacterium]